MGLAETRVAIKEEWVITVAWSINDTAGSGNGKVIVGADYEIIEGVFTIEAGVVCVLVLADGLADGTNVFFD